MKQLLHQARCRQCRGEAAEARAVRSLLRHGRSSVSPAARTRALMSFRQWQPSGPAFYLLAGGRAAAIASWVDSRLVGFRTCLVGMTLMALSGLLLGFRGRHADGLQDPMWECARAEGVASLVIVLAFTLFIWRARRPVCEGMYGLAAGLGALVAQLVMHLPTLGTLCLKDTLVHVAGTFAAMFVGCLAGYLMPPLTYRVDRWRQADSV